MTLDRWDSKFSFRGAAAEPSARALHRGARRHDHAPRRSRRSSRRARKRAFECIWNITRCPHALARVVSRTHHHNERSRGVPLRARSHDSRDPERVLGVPDHRLSLARALRTTRRPHGLSRGRSARIEPAESERFLRASENDVPSRGGERGQGSWEGFVGQMLWVVL